MKKVNIRFHENHTVSYQHEKILQFVPELSVDKTTRITTPNIPLLVWFPEVWIVLLMKSNKNPYFCRLYQPKAIV